MKKKTLGSSTSFVHGKVKELTCHDMRKYILQQYDFLQNKNISVDIDKPISEDLISYLICIL